MVARIMNGAQYASLDGEQLQPSNFFARISVDSRPWYDYNNSAMCGGTVISPQIIVTAAHCVRPRLEDEGFSIPFIPLEFLSVRIGATDMGEGSGHGVTIDTIYVRTDYDASSLANDIAVIRLAAAMPEEIYCGMPLGRLGEGAQLAQTIGMGAASGSESGGDSRVLRSAFVVARTGGEGCAADRICGSPLRDSIGALCTFDSGGPLLTFSKPAFRLQLVGIARSASSAACMEHTVTNYYTPVTPYSDDLARFVSGDTPHGWVDYVYLVSD